MAAAILLVIDSGSSLFADYADGHRTEARTLQGAVLIWRQSAWRQDDFFSQLRLGDLYSGKQSFAPAETPDNPGFIDPVEAYVWYFLALRPNRAYMSDDSGVAADSLDTIRSNALRNAAGVYLGLTFEQRLDARARIIYILASRGAKGFMTLGRLHASVLSYYDRRRSGKPYLRLCMTSWWAGDAVRRGMWSAIAWVKSLFKSQPDAVPHHPVWKWTARENFDSPDHWQPDEYYCGYDENASPEPADNFAAANGGGGGGGAIALNNGGAGGANAGMGANAGNAGDNGGDQINLIQAGHGGAAMDNAAGGGGWIGQGGAGAAGGGMINQGQNGDFFGPPPVPSVFAVNDAEAFSYFRIAQKLGHPLASLYAQAVEANIKNYLPDADRIIADADNRAQYWLPPFEFYPGAIAGGFPHSDESEPSLEQRLALARINELPLPAVLEALAFRGFLKRGFIAGCRPLSPCFRDAVRAYQAAVGFEVTGLLTAAQTVRLIQMAAWDGDALSQNRLGIMYAKGIGVPLNFLRAEKWFTKAANQNYPDALFNLYVLYKVGGNGIERDQYKAVSFFKQAELAGSRRTRSELLDLLNQADDAGHDHPDGARR